jgi:hypothetical protein
MLFFFISSFLCIYHELKTELDEELMDQKSLSKLQKIPRMSSHCPYIILSNGVASFTFPFTGDVCCTLTDTVNHLPLLQVLWQLCVSPSALFNNHSVTSYILSLKTIISVSCQRHFTLYRITLMQPSLRGI